MDVAQALTKLRPGAIFTIRDNDLNRLDWQDGRAIPTAQEVSTAWDAIVAQQAADAQTAATAAANAATLSTQADTALDSIRTYIALASPTAAQTTAEVKLLSKVVLALVRLQLKKLDATD